VAVGGGPGTHPGQGARSCEGKERQQRGRRGGGFRCRGTGQRGKEEKEKPETAGEGPCFPTDDASDENATDEGMSN